MTWMLPLLCLDPPRPGLWVRDWCRCEWCKTPAADEQADIFVFARVLCFLLQVKPC